MPKIIFIKNVDDEIIYPKTHEDAILTVDGLSISSKIQSITDVLKNKSDSGHTHDFSTLTGTPPSVKASGGNADTVANKIVDDTKVGYGYLWTSQKVFNEISNNGSSFYVGPTEPLKELVWIDTNNNVLKYKFNGVWITLGTDLKYV